MRRAAGTTVLAIAVLMGATGCMPPFLNACPAIGYISGVAIDTRAYGDAIFVQVCVETECSLAPDDDPSADGGSIGVSPTEAGWSATFLAELPDAITVRVYDLVGGLVAEQAHDIEWTHSTERCGGPSTAPPVVLV